MRKLRNPYQEIEGYNCFACSPNNESGLQMEFYEEGEYIFCDWEPKGFMQGYFNVLHGGIQSTLMDEIAAWLVQVKLKTAGVTSAMNSRFLKAVPVNEGKIKIRAKLKGIRRNLADIEVELFCPDGEPGAKAEVTYYTFPEDLAREKLSYPGYNKF
jgi:acyl-coenzyme A thioesterase PaaI-like protein